MKIKDSSKKKYENKRPIPRTLTKKKPRFRMDYNKCHRMTHPTLLKINKTKLITCTNVIYFEYSSLYIDSLSLTL